MADDDDTPDLDPWDNSTGLHFSIDFSLANHRLTQQQRNVLRTMVLNAMTECTAKVMLLGLDKFVRVEAEERASGAGMRKMVIPREDTHE